MSYARKDVQRWTPTVSEECAASSLLPQLERQLEQSCPVEQAQQDWECESGTWDYTIIIRTI